MEEVQWTKKYDLTWFSSGQAEFYIVVRIQYVERRLNELTTQYQLHVRKYLQATKVTGWDD